MDDNPNVSHTVLRTTGHTSLEAISIPVVNLKLAKEFFQLLAWDIKNYQVREPGMKLKVQLIEITSNNDHYYSTLPLVLFNNDPEKAVEAIQEWVDQRGKRLRVTRDPARNKCDLLLLGVFPFLIVITKD